MAFSKYPKVKYLLASRGRFLEWPEPLQYLLLALQWSQNRRRGSRLREKSNARHWPFPDPAKYSGSDDDTRAHFHEVFTMITKLIDKFLMNER